MQNLAQTTKIGIFRPRTKLQTGKCSKLKIENFRDGSSDCSLSVDGKILLQIQENIAQNSPKS